jgi:hypothetical protein
LDLSLVGTKKRTVEEVSHVKPTRAHWRSAVVTGPRFLVHIIIDKIFII